MQIENLYKSLVVRYNKDYAPIYGQPPIDLTSSQSDTVITCKVADFLTGALGKFSEDA